MALASDIECWYLIVSENTVCDVMQNLCCYVDLEKYKSFVLNRICSLVGWNFTAAASE